MIDWITKITGLSPDALSRIIITLIIILFLWLVRAILLRFIKHQTENEDMRKKWQRNSFHIAVIIGLVLSLRIWLIDFHKTRLSEWLNNFTGISPQVQNRIFSTLLIIFFLWLLRILVVQFVWHQTENIQTRYKWQKSSIHVTVILGIMLVSRVWFVGFQSVATYLGLVTAGIAIALKNLVESFAGWLFISWRRPFYVGDRIQVGDYRGDVIDIRVFKFTLMEIGNWVDAEQSTGRIIHIPNSMVITDVLANYSRGFQFIWHEIPVLITFESNWERAKSLLMGIANQHAEHLTDDAAKKIKEASKKFMIFYTTLKPTVYTSVKDSGVLLTIRYLIDPRRRRSSEQSIWESILHEFAQCSDIDFAYPTTRFFNNTMEGKQKGTIESK